MSTNGQSYDGPILECKNVCISYFTRAGEIPAVVDFNLTLHQGESVGLVGESGCGKSTVAMAIMQYMGKNGGIVGGQIIYKGRDMATYERGRAAAAARQRDLHGLPGADGLAESQHDARRAAHRSAALSRGHFRAGGRRPGDADARRRQAAGSRTGDEFLPAPDLGRSAAARGHRHGPAVEPLLAAAGRTDHGARRDGRGRHRRTDRRDRGALQHLDDLHLAQPRPDPRHLRPDQRDVFRRGGRRGYGARGVRPDAAPLHPGAVRRDSAARRRQDGPAAGADPRPVAAAARASARLFLRAALRPLRRGHLQQRCAAYVRGSGRGRAHGALRPLVRHRLGVLQAGRLVGRGRSSRATWC